MANFYEMTIYILAMAITPGPNCILSMVNAAQKGFPKCLSLNLGMSCGNLILDTVAYCLVAVLVKYMPVVQPVLQVLGIFYILYLAYCMFKRGEIKISQKSGDFKTGFLFQFMNVKVMLLAVTVVSAYVLPAGLPFWKGYLTMPYLCLIALGCTVTWALGGAVLSKVYNRYRKSFNFLFGMTLIALAVSNSIKFINFIYAR